MIEAFLSNISSVSLLSRAAASSEIRFASDKKASAFLRSTQFSDHSCAMGRIFTGTKSSYGGGSEYSRLLSLTCRTNFAASVMSAHAPAGSNVSVVAFGWGPMYLNRTIPVGRYASTADLLRCSTRRAPCARSLRATPLPRCASSSRFPGGSGRRRCSRRRWSRRSLFSRIIGPARPNGYSDKRSPPPSPSPRRSSTP